MDEGLEEPIASIIWATPRLQSEAQELCIISEQLTAKYGKEFTQCCRANTLNNVNEKLVHKLNVQAPPQLLVDKYLEEIAKSYNVSYLPSRVPDNIEANLLYDELRMGDSVPKNGGGSVRGGGGSALPAPPSEMPSAPSNKPFVYPEPASQPKVNPQMVCLLNSLFYIFDPE